MSKAYVLRALGILGLEEILNLSKVLMIKKPALKKAAGEELIAWDETKETAEKVPHKEPAKVLAFPQRAEAKPEPQVNPEAKDDGQKPEMKFLDTDMVLMQRELAKEVGHNIHQLDAHKGYKKTTEVYVVKSTVEGKETIRFASTDGVLVNKKQA